MLRYKKESLEKSYKLVAKLVTEINDLKEKNNKELAEVHSQIERNGRIYWFEYECRFLIFRKGAIFSKQ